MTDSLTDVLDELAAMGTDYGRSLQASVVTSLWLDSRADYLEMKEDAEAWRLAQAGIDDGRAAEQDPPFIGLPKMPRESLPVLAGSAAETRRAKR